MRQQNGAWVPFKEISFYVLDSSGGSQRLCEEDEMQVSKWALEACDDRPGARKSPTRHVKAEGNVWKLNGYTEI